MKHLLLLLLFGCLSSEVLSATAKPNIIVIFTDDMGYGDIGPFSDKHKTPNLDRMAAKGVKLTSLAEAVKNYPALDKSGGSATEAGEELGATTTDDDDKEAKRKANRAMKKEAEAKEAK